MKIQKILRLLTINACESFDLRFKTVTPLSNIGTSIKKKYMQTESYLKINSINQKEERCIRKVI